ncbi:vanadium-dependent haloperoxidase [Aquimarina sp. ERC-38]|nr:vanadium-dependent haloperoxidase [Aquimarina sp. ERC-38]UZO82636.1 vanadium-dependent haloperoxidase [Aquimarina sp. ERC-38]
MLAFFSCQNQSSKIEVTSANYHEAVDKITEVMVHDIFSPPVASRIYNYANIAAYEVIQQSSKNYKTLASQVKDLQPVQKADTSIVHLEVAALIAYLEVGKSLLFSEDRIQQYQDSLYKNWHTVNKNSFEVSKEYGEKVANHIKDWYKADNYAQTRTMPKFSVNTDDPSRWQPTPPDYMSGIEPHWAKIRPMVLKDPSQFKPNPFPKFSLEKETSFYKEVVETYKVGKQIREEGESSEKLKIAQFWDCNPYVSTHKGHLMFATKKITPGAHWIGICKIACQKTNTDFIKTIYAYTRTSVAIADAFISCWDEKYRSNLIRPETLINQYIDQDWEPILQTPPFPEYTSGHSVVSGAAATVLTDIFGDNFSFDDTTEVAYGLPVRSFSSFYQAAEEAAVSRLYGGIHYRSAIDLGLLQGKNMGTYVVENVKLKVDKESSVASK